MSIESVRDQLNRTILSYNAKKKEINKKFSNDNMHSPEWKDIQMKLLRSDMKKEFLSSIGEIKKQLQKEESYSQREIAKVKFPHSMSDSDNKRIAGELQQNNAHLFLMSNPKPEQVLLAVRAALSTERTDYAFVLIETMKSKLSGDNNQESRYILEELAEIESSIDMSRAKEYEKDLSAVPVIKETVSSFERFVSADYLTESFISKEAIESMSQEEVSNNIDSVNASLTTA